MAVTKTVKQKEAAKAKRKAAKEAKAVKAEAVETVEEVVEVVEEALVKEYKCSECGNKFGGVMRPCPKCGSGILRSFFGKR